MSNTTTIYQNIVIAMPRASSNSCDSNDEDSTDYNLNLRIGSVFIVLAISFVASILPVLSNNVKCLRIHPIIINTGKFFGTGVILATALIHILPSAMNIFADDCMPDGWKDYEAYGTLFAMLAVLFMHLIEFVAHHFIHPTSPSEVKVHVHESKAEFNGLPTEGSKVPEPAIISVTGSKETAGMPPVEDCEQHHGHSHGSSILEEGASHRVSTYLVEFGIAIHSILIGMTLGTEAGSTFVALFIAICFHQFFEAIALGAQIAKIKHKSILPAIIMVTIFTLTTPVGIAIGIAIHETTSNTKSPSALISTGILESVASGILLYAALVNLIAAEMSANSHEFFKLSKPLKVLYFIALYLGAALMAIIGKWA